MFVQVEIWQVVCAEGLHACVKNQNHLTCSCNMLQEHRQITDYNFVKKKMILQENSAKTL